MDDALSDVVNPKLWNIELSAVLIEDNDLLFRDRVVNTADPACPVCRWNIVIRRRQICIQAPGTPTGEPESLECLRRGDFVQQVTIYVEHGESVVSRADYMLIPDLVVESASHGKFSAHRRVMSSEIERAC